MDWDTSVSSSASRGQALVELAVCLPLLAILLALVFSAGVVMYTGANVSTAVKTATENKILMADSPNAAGLIQGWVNQYNSGSFQVNGLNADGVNVVRVGNVISIARGQKQVVPPPVPFITIPNFNFTAVEGLHTRLLMQNSGPFSSLTQVPIDEALAAIPATIDPADFDMVSGIPTFVPITDDCTPDLTVFSVQMNPGMTFTEACNAVTGCPLAQTIAFANTHVNAMRPVACNDAPRGTGDVTYLDFGY